MGGGCACVGTGEYGKSLYPLLSFVVNLKLALKQSIQKKKKKKGAWLAQTEERAT